MPNPTLTVTVEEQAGLLGKRFHTLHEQRFAQQRGRDEVSWEDMPEAYRDRLIGTFGCMIRESSLTEGAGLRFLAEADAPALF